MVFGKLFGKKEEPPKEVNLTNLDIGYILDYDLRSWEVKAVYEYDWGNNHYAVEYKIDSGSEILYLYVDEWKDMEISISSKVSIYEVDQDLKEHIVDNDEAPKKLNYKGVRYFLDDDSPGYCRDLADGEDDDAWSKLVNYTFVDEKEEIFISVDRWSETDFEASAGRYCEAFEFSNFLPRE